MKNIIPLLLIVPLFFVLAILGKRKLIKDYIQPLFIGFVSIYIGYVFYVDNVEFQKCLRNPLSVQTFYVFCSLGWFCGGFFLLYIVFERTKVYLKSKKYDHEQPPKQKK